MTNLVKMIEEMCLMILCKTHQSNKQKVPNQNTNTQNTQNTQNDQPPNTEPVNIL